MNLDYPAVWPPSCWSDQSVANHCTFLRNSAKTLEDKRPSELLQKSYQALLPPLLGFFFFFSFTFIILLLRTLSGESRCGLEKWAQIRYRAVAVYLCHTAALSPRECHRSDTQPACCLPPCPISWLRPVSALQAVTVDVCGWSSILHVVPPELRNDKYLLMSRLTPSNVWILKTESPSRHAPRRSDANVHRQESQSGLGLRIFLIWSDCSTGLFQDD